MPTITGTSGPDTLSGTSGDDILTGLEGDDILNGLAGSDTLRGGPGPDQLTGGAGADVFVFAPGDSTGTAIDSIADFQTGSDIIVIEGVLPTGLSLVRTNGGGTLIFAGHGSGPQTVIGVNGSIEATDVFGSDGLLLRVNLVGSDYSDVLIGTSLGDTIYGGEGDDTLVGSLGYDILSGGPGRDTFYFSSALDSTEAVMDLITDFGVSGPDVIDLTALHATSLTIRRLDSRDNVVSATTPSGIFQVLLRGGPNGISPNSSNISLGYPTAINFIGSNSADIFVGTALADVISAQGGDDVLTGGTGADAIASGGGRDTYAYVAVTDSNAAAYDNLYDFETGFDRIDLTALNPTSISVIRTDNGSSFVFAQTPGGDFMLAADRRAVNGTDFFYANGFGIYLAGSSNADILTGSSLADPIQGGAGNDTITGGGGADAISGGVGADIFRYLTPSDSSQAAGFDNLYDFETGIDKIDLTPLNTTSVSIIHSDNGSSYIFAQSVAGDFLTTGDRRTVQATDVLYSNRHGVYMVGSANADTLIGSALNDPIYGGAGDDIIIGGGGNDTLGGQGGADTFVYLAASDSSRRADADIIVDFETGVDRIDLRAVRTGASDAFGIAYQGTGSFLFVDLGGDGVNEMLIQLANTRLVSSDILWSASGGNLEPGVKKMGPEALPVEATDADNMMALELSQHTGPFMLNLDANVAGLTYHGQDWYL